MTVLLSCSEINSFVDIDATISLLREGFRTSSPRFPPIRSRTALPGNASATALLPGLLDGIPAYTVKVNAKFPGARPALRGVVCLHSSSDGELLALLDSASITALRTGLAAAFATDVLAGPDSETVGVIGAGAQAEVVVRGLARLRPVNSIVVHDLDPERAGTFSRRTGFPVSTAPSPRAVANACRVVIVATWSRQPLLELADVAPGTHITALGADEPGKVELAGDLLTAATTVVDDPVLAATAGALSAVGLSANAAVPLGAVLLGEHRGRTDPGERTVYAPVGLPWQDLALAWPVYEAARDAHVYDFLA